MRKKLQLSKLKLMTKNNLTCILIIKYSVYIAPYFAQLCVQQLEGGKCSDVKLMKRNLVPRQ